MGDRGGGYDKWRRDGNYPAFLCREARHEAAHAVIDIILGLSVVHVTLGVYGTGSKPYTRIGVGLQDEVRRVIVGHLAGHAADYLAGEVRGDWRHTRRNLEDIRAAKSWHEDSQPEESMDFLWRLTLRLVRRHEEAIDLVAELLLERETMSGDEVRRLACP